jgi:AraC family transcriptional regulator
MVPDLLEDKRSGTIEKVKNLIIDQIQNKDDSLNTNYSNYLSKELGLDYSYLSNLFSSIENITIEKFIIHQKIQKVQELLVYNELNLNEIAYKMNYSSVQALSMQFKKIMGYTPSHYKELKEIRRIPLA